ncbi:lipopolysaccharide biosynthesis protein [Croceivirga lutea]|uniref:lipopolysaccharide biosynthesis protein n=1 Tax=Croceivirga lutea TaxID=1775167 RepID=UPI0016395398|nr:lipopolysaccharide biosynthesis protein [Croceivirga lutea]GGG42531.1 lipopolysaccharide biosynthesis protein [Croceivirga lutea]
MSTKLLSYLWNSIEKFGIQVVRFVIGIILARILSPTDYGLIGLLIVFTALAQIFVDSGFSRALMQRNDKDISDVNTSFTFNIFVSFFFYTLLFLFAPLIADFYDESILTDLLRVLALTLIINSFYAIHNTILAIDLNFKKIAIINFSSILISGLIAILLAYKGFGVWSLVYQYIIKSTLSVILFWSTKCWSPKLYFSKSSFKRLYKFGYNVTISSLLNQIVDKFSWLFIGKTFSTADLGYYNRGIQFPDAGIGTVGSVLDSVLLPNLAKNKNQSMLILEASKILKFLTLFTIPLAVILGVLGEPIVLLLLTEKWIAAVPILQIFCACRLITNISTINTNLLYVINKANLVLRQQYIKILVRIVFIIIALKYGIIYVALAELISVIIHFFIGSYFPGKIMKFGAFKQLKIISPFLILGIFETVILYFISNFIEGDFLKILVISFLGITIHVLIIYTFFKEEYFTLKKIIRRK